MAMIVVMWMDPCCNTSLHGINYACCISRLLFFCISSNCFELLKELICLQEHTFTPVVNHDGFNDKKENILFTSAGNRREDYLAIIILTNSS